MPDPTASMRSVSTPTGWCSTACWVAWTPRPLAGALTQSRAFRSGQAEPLLQAVQARIGTADRRAHWVPCGEDRLCARIDARAQPTGDDRDYRVIAIRR